MAQITNLFDSYDAAGEREDLSDAIFRVTPSDTPLLSMIRRTTATNVFHEWQTDSLAAVDTTNAQIEGFVAALADPAATTRVGNRCQILAKVFGVSRTLEVANKAGRASEVALQTTKRGLELRRDLETACIGLNNASVTGSNSAAREIGSLGTWLTTNDNGTPGASPANRGTNGGSTGFSSGNTVAATDGTTRAFTQAILDGVISKLYTNSGMVDDAVIMAGPSQKAVLTGFDGIAGTVYHEAKDRTIIGTADVYASQFGDIKIVPNRYLRQTSSVDREAYVIRPEYLALAVFDPLKRVELAKTGDAQQYMMTMECTLQVSNEAAHGICADLS